MIYLQKICSLFRYISLVCWFTKSCETVHEQKTRKRSEKPEQHRVWMCVRFSCAPSAFSLPDDEKPHTHTHTRRCKKRDREWRKERLTRVRRKETAHFSPFLMYGGGTGIGLGKAVLLSIFPPSTYRAPSPPTPQAASLLLLTHPACKRRISTNSGNNHSSHRQHTTRAHDSHTPRA